MKPVTNIFLIFLKLKWQETRLYIITLSVLIYIMFLADPYGIVLTILGWAALILLCCMLAIGIPFIIINIVKWIIENWEKATKISNKRKLNETT